MLQVDKYWLDSMGACEEAQSEFEERFGSHRVYLDKLIEVMKKEKDEKYLEWGWWLIFESMTRLQLQEYALYLLNKITPLLKEIFKKDEDKKQLKIGLKVIKDLKFSTRPLSNRKYCLIEELKDRAYEINTPILINMKRNALRAFRDIMACFEWERKGLKAENVQDAVDYEIRVFGRNEKGRITNKNKREVSIQIINKGVRILGSKK